MEPAEGIALPPDGPGISGETVQPAEVRRHVEVGVLRPGDLERGGRQIDLRLRPLNREGKGAQ
jgi:hypothetical protein